MPRLIINLGDREKDALNALAEKEMRDPRLQAAFIICQALEKQGLIETQDHVVPAVAGDDIKSQEEIQHA